MEKYGVVKGEGDEPVKEAADQGDGPRHPVGADLMSRMSRSAADAAQTPGQEPQDPVPGQ